MQEILFSIIVVALNPGNKLKKTIESIVGQTYSDYEILLKDGGSTDGSIENIKMLNDSHLVIKSQKDSGIYDAMNQAVVEARGRYVLFLNCGDTFYNKEVLHRTQQEIERRKNEKGPKIFYGNTYAERTASMVMSPPSITGFTCYRNIPCHQSCFYQRSLLEEKKYDPDYRIRADYEHFLWCFYKAHAKLYFMDIPIASYEGGGYSESAINKKRDREEHKLITKVYMNGGELLKYKVIMAITLAPLRRFLGENEKLAVFYNGVKRALYHRSR